MLAHRITSPNLCCHSNSLLLQRFHQHVFEENFIRRSYFHIPLMSGNDRYEKVVGETTTESTRQERQPYESFTKFSASPGRRVRFESLFVQFMTKLIPTSLRCWKDLECLLSVNVYICTVRAVTVCLLIMPQICDGQRSTLFLTTSLNFRYITSKVCIAFMFVINCIYKKLN